MEPSLWRIWRARVRENASAPKLRLCRYEDAKLNLAVSRATLREREADVETRNIRIASLEAEVEKLRFVVGRFVEGHALDPKSVDAELQKERMRLMTEPDPETGEPYSMAEIERLAKKRLKSVFEMNDEVDELLAQCTAEEIAALARVDPRGVSAKFLQEAAVLAHSVHAIHHGVHERNRAARVANGLIHEPHSRHRHTALHTQPLFPRLDLREWVEEDKADTWRWDKFKQLVVEADDIGEAPAPEAREGVTSASVSRVRRGPLREFCALRTWRPPFCVHTPS